MALGNVIGLALPFAIHSYWILATAAATIAALPIRGLPTFRELVRLSASRGKLWDGRPRPSLGVLTDASVPQAYFAHFYAVGLVSNCCCMLVYFTLLQGQNALSNQQAASVLALAMLQLHLSRRLYESCLVMVYPAEARMHVIAYTFGISYYIVLSISMLPCGDLSLLLQRPVDLSYLKISSAAVLFRRVITASNFTTFLGCFVFCCGNLLQNQSHRILARLGKRSKTAQRSDYSIPSGGGFSLVSCPHYLGEIIIYCGLVIAMRGSHLDTWLILAWVVSNLVVAAGATQAWYRRHFKTYPASRKALLPYIW